MEANVAQWARRHGIKVLGWVAASAITAALLSACSGSCAGDNNKVVTTPAMTTTTTAENVATPNDTAAADNETVSGAPTGHRHTLATARADKTGATAVAGDATTDTMNEPANPGVIQAATTPPPNPAVEGLERGHTRTLVGWSDKGLVVTYAGWFCDDTVALNEGKVDSKTANVSVAGVSDGNGTNCDKATAVSATFPNVPRTAHVLKLDPGHGRQIETVKFTSGDIVQNGSFTTEETAVGINDKHGATH